MVNRLKILQIPEHGGIYEMQLEIREIINRPPALSRQFNKIIRHLIRSETERDYQ